MLVFSDVFGVALGDVEAAPVAPHAVSFSSSGAPGLIAREPTEARLTGHADGMVVQREQVPGPGWQLPSAGYRELMGLLLRSNPSSQIFGGHYSRLGMPWEDPVSPASLSQGIRDDVAVGLAGSLVFEMPLMVGRCRSTFDSCDEGIFHQRKLPAAEATPFNALLFWPNEAVALSGWFQRWTSVYTVPQGRQLQVVLSDSLALRREPVASLDEFRKRVRGASSGTVYYESPTGVFTNLSATCGASGRCPGASPGVRCIAACAGAGMGVASLTFTTAEREPVVVELSTGSAGSTHALTEIQVQLPTGTVGSGSDSWRFSSGIDEEQDLSTAAAHYRALYNASVKAFAGG